LRKVAHDAHVGPAVLAVPGSLFEVVRHPGTASLGGARKEVCVEIAHEATALLFLHFKGFHVWMVDGDVFSLVKSDAKQAAGVLEHSGDHVLELEVRPE